MAYFSKPVIFSSSAAILVTAAGVAAFQYFTNGYPAKDATPEQISFATDTQVVHEFAQPDPKHTTLDPQETKSIDTGHQRSTNEVVPLSALDHGGVTLWGTMQTESGAAVANETAVLYSKSQNESYTTTSNDHGEFVFVGIRSAADFRVSVSPKGMYQRYEKYPIAVGLGRPALKIILKPLPVGDLTGFVVDTQGNPVPDFELSLRSEEKFYWVAKVISDGSGLFLVQRMPKGRFNISSRRRQLLDIKGFNFDPESTIPLTLIVDIGPYSLHGHVYDDSGQPYAGAHVFLFWSVENAGVRARSTRQVTADPKGAFLFDGLGAGEHELVVSTFSSNAVKRVINLGVDPEEHNIILKTTAKE